MLHTLLWCQLGSNIFLVVSPPLLSVRPHLESQGRLGPAGGLEGLSLGADLHPPILTTPQYDGDTSSSTSSTSTTSTTSSTSVTVTAGLIGGKGEMIPVRPLMKSPMIPELREMRGPAG